MSDTKITTKPFVSRAQQRFAFGTNQPWAKRWAKETNFAKFPKRARRKASTKSYSVAEFAEIALKEASDPVATTLAAMHTPELLTLKGEQLAPGVTRIHGDLCNVHGRWGSCRAAGYGGGAATSSKRVPPKKLPTAPKPKAGTRKRAAGGKKGGAARAAAKPKLTPEQRAQQRQTERQQNRTATVAKLRNQPNAAAMDAMAKLERGEPIDPDMAKALADETGLVDLHKDGSATLSPTGRSFLHALDRGDVAAAEDAQGRAQDQQARADERQTAASDRKRAADERRAAIEAKRAEAARLRAERLAKQKKGGGGGKGKKPAVAPKPAAAPRTSSARPRPVFGGGGKSPRQPQPKKPPPQLPQALTDAAQALSDGKEIDATTEALLIRNGLAKRNKDGVLILTAAGQRATKKEARLKATPARTLDAGHTGVMVALHPDAKARQQIAATEGITEPADQLHLTLCYLGDSTEQPLAEGKGALLDAVQQWAATQRPLKGVINGAGRFFHAEDDGTNAVYVSPDVPGLPELRQSLIEVIEATGFDYSQDHGFMPHITVAYVPLDAPTPPIRIETPVTFDRATLAWGDEQYDFPLGATKKEQAEKHWMPAHRAVVVWEQLVKAAPSPGDYLIVEDTGKPTTWHLQVKRNGKVDHRLLGAAWAALHGGFRGNKYEGPNKGEALTKLKRLYAQEGMPLPSEKSFAVFKDASGRYRWIARTTTAYRDRDDEIISEKALEDDAAHMTATGVYGPLRYWHVGRPDPFSLEAPWGPGLDIGTCDFSIVIGRTSIESGTFKTEAIGRAFSEDASSYELSPGFFHAPTEPDARTGVFNHIRRFERSVVPTQHGRASNLFTGLTVKEHQMDQATYDKRVKAYLDFAREKGIPPEDAAAPIVAMEQADKEAAAKQIAYKEEGGKKPAIIDFFRAFFTDEQQPQTTIKEEAPAVEPSAMPPPTDEVAGQWVGADALAALKTQIDTLTSELASLKAPSMMDMEDDPAQGGDAGVDEAAEGEPPMDEGGLTLSSDDLSAIGQMFGGVLQAALEPLVGALGITQKLDGHMTELKGLLGGYVKQKEAADTTRTDMTAALKATIDQQQAAIAESQAKLTELLGDQPRNAGYRPSQAADNGAEQLLAAIKDGPDGAVAGPFDDLIANLFPGLAQGGTA